MLATIWIRLGTTTDKINDRLSVQWAIVEHPASWCTSSWILTSFFSVAFLGFMSVAGIPSFLEVRNFISHLVFFWSWFSGTSGFCSWTCQWALWPWSLHPCQYHRCRAVPLYLHFAILCNFVGLYRPCTAKLWLKVYNAADIGPLGYTLAQLHSSVSYYICFLESWPQNLNRCSLPPSFLSLSLR